MTENDTRTSPAVSGGQAPAEFAPQNEDPIFTLASSDTAFCRIYNIKTWRRLGGGATACVVRLFNRLRHENVAVKIFVQPRADIQHKIAAEVRITDTVVSPNVVRLFGPHEGDAFMWIEMEYIDGQTLMEHLDDLHAAGQVMPIHEAVDLGIEITRGVVALHSAGIVHRDLKPENILLPASGKPRAKIADLGIARFWEKQRSTQTSEWRGTPIYGAPETFNSSTRTDGTKATPLTPEADIYSLGVLLFRMLTGEFVFPVRDEGDTYEVVAAHLHGHPRRARTLNVGVPADVEQLLVQMVARHPADRPTLRHVLEVLERHTSSEGRRRTSTPPAPSLSHEVAAPSAHDAAWAAPTRFVRAQRLRAPIATGAVLLVAMTVLFLWPRSEPTTLGPATGNRPVDGNPPRVASAPRESVAIPHVAAASAPTTGVTSPAGPGTRPVATKAPEPAPTSAVTIDVQADGVVLANGGPTRIPSTDLVVVAADGSRYQFTSPDAMESGSQVMVPFAMFQPEIPQDARLRRIDVVIGPGHPHVRLSRHLD